MKDVDIYGLVIITVLIGGLLTFLGWVMKSQNAGDMLNGFDANKYDKNKVSMIVGKDFLYTGIVILLLGGLGIFLDSKYYNYVTFVQVGVLVLGIIKGMYEMEKKCRLPK